MGEQAQLRTWGGGVEDCWREASESLKSTKDHNGLFWKALHLLGDTRDRVEAVEVDWGHLC